MFVQLVSIHSTIFIYFYCSCCIDCVIAVIMFYGYLFVIINLNSYPIPIYTYNIIYVIDVDVDGCVFGWVGVIGISCGMIVAVTVPVTVAVAAMVVMGSMCWVEVVHIYCIFSIGFIIFCIFVYVIASR